MSDDKSNWGGRRKGSGAPRLREDEETVRKSLTLPESMAAFLTRLGDGTFSEGVRRAARIAMEAEE
jgi:hypothetical protein